MEQRLFYTVQHLPLRVQGALCAVSVQQCTAAGAGSSWNWNLWGNTRSGQPPALTQTSLRILMASSKLGLSAPLTIIVQKLAPKSSFERCLQNCLLLVQGIWVFQVSAAHTLNCFVTWLSASVWGKSSAAKSVDGTDDWDGTSSLLKIHWEANVNMLPSPVRWVAAELQTPPCLWAGIGEALGRLSCEQHHKNSEQNNYPCPTDPAQSVTKLNFMFLFPELKLGWSSASTAVT